MLKNNFFNLWGKITLLILGINELICIPLEVLKDGYTQNLLYDIIYDIVCVIAVSAINCLIVFNIFKNERLKKYFTNSSTYLIYIFIIVFNFILSFPLYFFQTYIFNSNNIESIRLSEFIIFNTCSLIMISAIIYSSFTLFRLKNEINEVNIKILKLQINQIRNRINPHFIFNHLNSGISLIHEDPFLAEKYLITLSKILRISVDTQLNKLSFIYDEIDMMNKLIDLFKISHGDILVIENSLDNNILNKKIVNGSFLLIIENILKHNSCNFETPLKVTISSEENYIIIRNELRPYKNKPIPSKIGLSSLSAQYTLMGMENIIYGIKNDVFEVKLPIYKEASL